jgi:flagellar biosynthesis protein FliR
LKNICLGSLRRALTGLFISETLIGALIGFLARIFLALETLAGVIAMSIGLTSVLAGPIEENEPLPAIATGAPNFALFHHGSRNYCRRIVTVLRNLRAFHVNF